MTNKTNVSKEQLESFEERLKRVNDKLDVLKQKEDDLRRAIDNETQREAQALSDAIEQEVKLDNRLVAQQYQEKLDEKQENERVMRELQKQEKVKQLTFIAWSAFIIIMIGLVVFATVYLWGIF